MMASKSDFYHSLTVDTDRCLGCAHCIRRCPTKALRIRGGKASLRKNWCVDCGECLKVCPTGAIYVEQDDFDNIFDYSCRAVLYPAGFLGQFPETDSEVDLHEALYALGFTHICPVELTVPVIREQMAAEIAASPVKPLISPFCPAIVRLIQTKFPDLVDHIMSIRMPVEATAILLRRRLEESGTPAPEIGIFYATPCAAKAASIKGGDCGREFVNGILNLNSLYNKVCQTLRNKKNSGVGIPVPVVSQEDMTWSMTSGEASSFGGRCFAVDGIHHVTEFIERLETTGEIHNIDFLELRACDRSCMGGALTPANRFLAEEQLRKRVASHPRTANTITSTEKTYLTANIRGKKPMPMTKLAYQGGIQQVLRQMNSAKLIESLLPGIDCGACGSPTCKSLSNDIVRHEAVLENCIFRQVLRAQQGDTGANSSRRLLEEVWGRNRFEKEKTKKCR